MKEALHIEMLLHAGADPSLADRHGNTPAHLAVLNQSPEALRSLVKYLRPGVTACNPFPELDYMNYDGGWSIVSLWSF
jgi:ankyrin repeat protein